MTSKPNFIDLFAGAGGLSEGFIQAGYTPIAHVEMDEAACFTLRTRAAFHHLKATKQISHYISYLKGEINRKTLYSLIPAREMDGIINLALSPEHNDAIFSQIDKRLKGKRIDLIIGGPPCQAYSLVGRARSADGMKKDDRNYLFMHYVSFLRKYRPKLFVFENVLGLKSAGGGKYFKQMTHEFSLAGYNIETFELNAKDFGVLQNRKRIIIIGHDRDLRIELSAFEVKKNKRHTVKSLLCDLPFIKAGHGKNKNGKYKNLPNEYLTNSGIRNGISVLTQHISRPQTLQDKAIYKIAVRELARGRRLNYTSLPNHLKSHNNQRSFFDRFKVVDNNSGHAQTVVAHIAKDGHYYIHPDVRQNRSLSIREAARIQSFPDDYYFEGIKETSTRTAAFRQIGNAVPPLLAEHIARKLKKLI